MGQQIFISHSNEDGEFVKKMRQLLEAHNIEIWVDVRNLRGGQKLHPEVEKAILDARKFVLVISPAVMNKPHWVLWELKTALQEEEKGKKDFVIPVLLPGVSLDTLEFFFDNEERAAIVIEDTPTALSDAIPEFLKAFEL